MDPFAGFAYPAGEPITAKKAASPAKKTASPAKKGQKRRQAKEVENEGDTQVEVPLAVLFGQGWMRVRLAGGGGRKATFKLLTARSKARLKPLVKI